MKYLNTGLLIIALMLINPAAVIAGNNPSANFLFEVGLKQYEQGDMQGAIHEWSKALMLEPDHEEALEHLNRVGIKEGLYKGSITHETHLANQARKIDEYQAKIAELEEQKNLMKIKFNMVQAENHTLMKERDSLYEENLEQQDLVKDLADEVNRVEEEMAVIRQQWETVEEPMAEEMEPEEIVKRQESINSQLNLLERYEAQNSFFTSHYDDIAMALNQEDELLKLSQRYEQSEQALSQYKADENNLVQVLEDYLYVRRDEVETLKNEVIFTSLDLTESQYQLLNTLDEMLQMEEEQQKLRDSLTEK